MATKTRTYNSERKHTRIDFSPLMLTCHLACMTPDSPAAQTANSLINEYEPDRSVSPTIIRPEVTVNDPDGVYTSGVNNRNLASDKHSWTVNGVAIATAWKEGTDYSIIKDATADNGSLKIMKNLSPDESAALKYEGVFNDFRTGTNYVVSADGMVLTTTDKGENKWSCSVDCEELTYDPLKDNLLLYEYLVANGQATAGQSANYKDGKCYERTVTVTLTKGTETLTSLPDGVTMRMVTRGTEQVVSAGDASTPEVVSIGFPSITFDMRVVEKAEYEVQFVQDSRVLTSVGISLRRAMSVLTQYDVARGTDIAVGQEYYYNNGIFATADQHISWPELYYDIQWWTQARTWNATTSAYEYAKRIDRQTGATMSCTVESMGMGLDRDTSWVDVAMDIEERGACALLTSEDESEVLTDESGNVLIY